MSKYESFDDWYKQVAKRCIYFIGKWELGDNEETGILVLNYCNHKDNYSNVEGNCNEHQCPGPIYK